MRKQQLLSVSNHLRSAVCLRLKQAKVLMKASTDVCDAVTQDLKFTSSYTSELPGDPETDNFLRQVYLLSL